MNHESILVSGRPPTVQVDNVNKDVALNCYNFMVRLRSMQLELIKEYHPGDEMRCPMHFCVGQEAAPAALAQIVSTQDFVLSHHRSHGYYLAKKGGMKELFAEFYGKKTGTNGGLAGSQEISGADINFYSGAIISGMIAIAVGVAFGNAYLKKPYLVFSCHGDGATEEGAFWEAISYASLQKLPVIFICENNRYSTYSPLHKRQPADDIHKRVEAFGIRSKAVFGNDPLALYRDLSEACQHVRKGLGPVFIEAYTYRHFGHVGPEDDDYVGYRPQAELEKWKENCPIRLLEEQLVAHGYIDQATQHQLQQEIDKEISEAFSFAKQSDFPEKPDDWEHLNCPVISPLADELLEDRTRGAEFNAHQEESKLMPY